MVLAPPYAAAPLERFAVPNSFSGLRWVGDSGAALVSDYDPARRRTDLWYVDFDDLEAVPRLVTGYSGDSARLPLMTTDSRGTVTLAAYDNGIYLRGDELDGLRRRSFLEHVSLATGVRRRVWQSSGEGYEALVQTLSPDAQLLLTRRETSMAPPNYFVSTSTREQRWPLTHFEHPAPPLTAAQHVRLEYRRDDGVDLAASLYLPPGYQRGSRLPLVVWAYPRQIGAGDAAKITSAEGTFLTFARAFRLFFLLRGYAVLDDVSMPIIGTENEANDTFVKQIVANAAAAIDAAESTGHIDATRVGVVGHSYGAFMVANLLAHSRLFAAGIAMSGAYNRTLTPFGFQTERRTLWQATQTYLAMSPLLFSDRIEAPLLLVHGLKDDNAGTSPQQSLQFYQAIRGNGGDVNCRCLRGSLVSRTRVSVENRGANAHLVRRPSEGVGRRRGLRRRLAHGVLRRRAATLRIAKRRMHADRPGSKVPAASGSTNQTADDVVCSKVWRGSCIVDRTGHSRRIVQ
jgi:dipeptidyl aminopeptidase/acylaminoacyl peptidase